MPLLCLSDVLKKAGIDPAKTKLLRHALSDKGFKACFDVHMVMEYTAHQGAGFSRGYEYWAVFISDKGNYARFYALYHVGDSVPDTVDVMPVGWPIANDFMGNGAYFDLQRMDELREYEGRILIDWGNSARMWHQRGITEKPIVAIQSVHKQPFPGYERVVLSYEQLKEVVENSVDYELWQTALSSVKAIYLIVDRESGKQYVGSAYGDDGLLGRWRCYVETLSGGNKLMKELLCARPEQYRHFQFSILQLIEKTATADEIIQTESLWKQKLQTIAFGMNAN